MTDTSLDAFEAWATASHFYIPNDLPYLAWQAGRKALADEQAQAVELAGHKTTGWVAPVDRYAVPVLFNPYTGEPRDVRDVQSDPQGVLIVPPGRVEMLAAKPTAESITDCMMNLVDRLGHEASSVDARAWSHLMVYAPKQAVEPVARVKKLVNCAIIDSTGCAECWEDLPDGTPLFTHPAPPPPAQQVAVPDMFWNHDDADKLYSSISEFLNDEVCNGTELAVGDIRTIQQAARLPNIDIRITSVNDEDCDADYEIVEVQEAKPVTKPDSRAKTDWAAA